MAPRGAGDPDDRGNIAGVEIPRLRGRGLRSWRTTTSSRRRPGSTTALDRLTAHARLDLEIKVLEEQVGRLAAELRITTQRVNLFEKVKIPEAGGEHQAASASTWATSRPPQVVRGKIAKRKAREGGVMIVAHEEGHRSSSCGNASKPEALKPLRRLGVLHAEPIEPARWRRAQEWRDPRSSLGSSPRSGILLSAYEGRGSRRGPSDYPQSTRAVPDGAWIRPRDQGRPSESARIPATRRWSGCRVAGGFRSVAELAVLRGQGYEVRALRGRRPKAAVAHAGGASRRAGRSADKTAIDSSGCPSGRREPSRSCRIRAPASPPRPRLEAEELRSCRADVARGCAWSWTEAAQPPSAPGARPGSAPAAELASSAPHGHGAKVAVLCVPGRVPAGGPGPAAPAEAAAKPGLGASCSTNPRRRRDCRPPRSTATAAGSTSSQPVFDFLGTVPGYREYDISASLPGVLHASFSPMIFGDGGYGMHPPGTLGVSPALQGQGAGDRPGPGRGCFC
ncbi:MAG: hypothetical protein M0C28_21780 [Candidatus Moduliflexus flocculans]|nr:hypothetical protein [Candidatus Moduliflexus flocculans]